MATIEKITKDIETTKQKITDLQKRLRTLEAQKIEEENMQIARLVKAVKLDAKQLTVFLKAYAKGDIILPEEYEKELQEETENEE